MEILRNKLKVQQLIDAWRKTGDTIGFIPTMGALHEGHLSLIHRSVSENTRTVVSIFVNPTQFNESRDFDLYPRDEASDIDKISGSKTDLIFLPDSSEIYGENPVLLDFEFDNLDEPMEGKLRPGHFKGVVTIVDILFEIVRPDRAYFGQKDFQQLAIVRLLAEKRHPSTEIVACPIIRESSGLAMSSRNRLLSPEELHKAVHLSEILFEISNNWKKLSFPDLMKEAFNSVHQYGIKLDYLELVDKRTLKPLTDDTGLPSVACIAARVGKIRLIDNIELPG